MVAAAVVAAGVVGAAASYASSSSASGAQTAASNNAIAAQRQMYDTTRADLQAYRVSGEGALNQLTTLTGSNPGGDAMTAPLTKPIVMDQATLEQTPGYQFNLSQGLKATQNSAAARGLGVSGAAMKGAAAYATGLADQTYQNQFNNAVTNQTNTYNRLMGISTLGESASAQTAALGTQTGANIGNNMVGIGNAQAAASMATGSAISGAASNAGNAYMLNNLLANKGGGGGGLYGTTNGYGAAGPGGN